MGLSESLVDVMRDHGVYVQPPDKRDRVGGWALMRQMTNAKEENGRPGLYISERCRYFWQTVPFLSRSELRPEDVDTRSPDHGADAARYATIFASNHRLCSNGFTIGHY